MKILNLYAGIGGNRKLWGDEHDITAVEWDKSTAEVYQSYFPEDEVIVGDAHEYLLNNYKEFDFIWASPPCPSHSDIRRCGVHSGQVEAVYPDMTLYQEIILLTHFAPEKTKWCIENVIPYYKPLIPGKKAQRHLFWTNFDFTEPVLKDGAKINKINGSETIYGFDIRETKIKDKRKALRNMVNPEVARHILLEAHGLQNPYLEQQNLF